MTKVDFGGFRTAARALPADQRGVSAIEFVLIFPILIALLAGTVDIGQALMVSRRVNLVVSTLGDMVSQQSSWTSTNVGAIVAGTATIMQPFDSAKLKIELAVVDIASDLSAKVNWSKGYNTAALLKNTASPVAIPKEIAEVGVQLIAVRATYELDTPFSKLLAPVTGVTTYHYDKTYIMRPRNKDTVTLD
ncbi:pilus assembly protein [Rhizobium sp. KVB221]|uniref:Pilus assembly protein n=1 Tax=Rhizobium setariae TaxID=2801340 RepID=A0A937CMS3_9HYPH|nr:TadE/TadG family type IV pilus assembly protein [Rhizobium setariae]MBL0371244.1 pilus assembly protein [Rhizobium setariae]